MADKAEQLKKKFKATDRNGDGKLDFDEMCVLLRQGNPNMKTPELMKLFKKVDQTDDGFIDFDEFVDYLYSGSKTSEARNAKLASQANGSGEEGPWDEVEAVLKIYDTQDNGLDNNEFAKILTDCKIFTRKFTKQDADVVFAKVCPKGKRRIWGQEFKEAIRIIATKKGVPTLEVQTVVGARASVGKAINATQQDSVRFYDDKTTFTGAHAKNDAFGDSVGGASADARRQARQADDKAKMDALGDEVDWSDCETVFKVYGGANGFEGREWLKVLDDAGLFSSSFTKQDADVAWATVAKSKKKINFEEFKQGLRVVGTKTKQPIAAVQSQVGARAADGPAKTGTTKTDEVRFYNESTQNDTGAARHERLSQDSAAAVDGVGEDGDWAPVEQVFKEYDKDVNGFDNKEFSKLLKDCNILVGKKLQQPDVDIIFSKVCVKGQRKLKFEEFKKALRHVAAKKECTIEDIQGLVAQRAGMGQVVNATKADEVRFHDDKNSYTGAHRDGAGEGEGARNAKYKAEAAAAAAEVGEEADWGDVEAAFKAYDKEGNGFDNKEFNTVLKDAGIIGKDFPSPDADIIFAKVCPKGKRKIALPEFKEALRAVAVKKKCSIADIQGKVGARSGGKDLGNATQADAVRFHDDKSTYTGAHTASHDGAGDQTDRAAARRASEDKARAELGEEQPWDSVNAAYAAYDPQGNGLDSKEFAKVLWDADLIDKKFTGPDADVIFAKFKTRKLQLEDFQEALRNIAMKKGCPIAEVQAAVGSREEGMKINATQADSVRFHDDKTTYTGQHAGK